MVKIYTSPSCSSCRKVKMWFKEQEIPFHEINILDGSLTVEDLKEILAKSLDGTEEIISKRSKIMKEKNLDVDSMKFNELLEFISKNPTILKRPIIVDDNKIQVGYNEEEIRVFIPHEKREQMWELAENRCENLTRETLQDHDRQRARVGRPRKRPLDSLHKN